MWYKVNYPFTTDPTPMVLHRANFLNDSSNILPKYNVVIANCGCVAVWCKTGKWCTLQALSIMHIPFLGSVAGTTAAATGAAMATTQVTVPAAGIMGWFGATTTTTTTVPLMVVQPWILPIIIVAGTVTIGGSAACLAASAIKFRQITKRMNAAFEQAHPEAAEEM